MAILTSLSITTEQKYLKAAICLLVLAGAAFAFPLPYITQTNVLAGLCLFPFVILTEGGKRVNLLFILLMIFFWVAAYRWNVKVFYFFCLSFFVLATIEMLTGKINSIVLFLILFMSPFFHQVSVVLGFPLRLQVSSIAGAILSSVGFAVGVEGNTMVLNGAAFAVDDACLGLSMLSVSMLAGVFFLSQFYKRTEARLSFLQLSLFFIGVLAVNVVTNLIRIILLVAFRIAPENFMHELIGLLCFAIYTMVPVYYFGKGFVARFGKPVKPRSFFKLPACWNAFILLLAGIAVMITGTCITERRPGTSGNTALLSLPGAHRTAMNDGITKFETDEMLIYIKPISEFFTGEHTPIMCWRGSGFAFQRIQIQTIAGKQVYTAQLGKNKERLYTAWWFTNDKKNTISQLEWRWAMLTGEDDFRLINITAKTEQTLHQKIASLSFNK